MKKSLQLTEITNAQAFSVISRVDKALIVGSLANQENAILISIDLQFDLNTDQYPRRFEDRSHTLKNTLFIG